MKKRMKVLLAFTLLCMICACGSEKQGQNAGQTDEVAESQQQTQDTSGDAATDVTPATDIAVDAQEEESPEASGGDGTWSGTWNAEDFEKFGISDMQEFGIAEVELYEGWDKSDSTLDAGLDVRWSGVDDFDAVTQYAEDLFQKTAAANGGNYNLVFSDDELIWVLDGQYETFADACLYWDKIDEYYAEWNYEKDGQVVKLVIWGAHNEEEDYMALNLTRYNQ